MHCRATRTAFYYRFYSNPYSLIATANLSLRTIITYHKGERFPILLSEAVAPGFGSALSG
jgi:hypothetical protein